MRFLLWIEQCVQNSRWLLKALYIVAKITRRTCSNLNQLYYKQAHVKLFYLLHSLIKIFYASLNFKHFGKRKLFFRRTNVLFETTATRKRHFVFWFIILVTIWLQSNH